MEEDVKSGAKPVVLGGLAAVAIGVLVFLMMPQPETDEAPAAVVVDTAVSTSSGAAAPEDVPDVAAEAPEPAQARQVPEFDTFRVDPDGSMVIAGRAEPGQTVDIILAGEALERVVADAWGNFVALPIASPAAQPRRLSLLADPEGDAIASTTSYIVAPIAAPVVIAAVEDPEPDVTPDATQAPADVQAVPSIPAPQAPTVPDVDLAPAAPVAPTVLQADADGVRVVQASPTLTAPEAQPNVALDAITYDPDGEVQLSGRATGDGAVQVYIDNEPVTASPVTEGGDWRIDLPDIATGVYTLRIDEVDAEGSVVSRLETPFRREEAADVAAVLAEETSVEGFEVAVRTVQPGATLWAIAEENLGAGIFYVEVYEANRDLIRDPDLIYPGQIFRIPEITQ